MSYQLELKNICKNYGDLKANENVNLRIKSSSIHALLGENGAGKSTLVNIIYGLVSRDKGDIYWQGEKIEIDSPIIARKIGIGIVFQHFALFEALNVTENIKLGIGYKKSIKELKKHIIKISNRYKLTIDPDAKISTLSAGEKQRVEIIRCLLQKPKLLILDEPTSVLTPVETNNLFTTLEQLRQDGCAVLFIGHKLDEIKQICSSATVLRKGKLIADCELKKMDVGQIAQMMVGSKINEYAKRDKNIKPSPILTIRNINNVDKFGFAAKELIIKTGRITGIAGIAGNGQDDLMSFLAGELQGLAEDVKYKEENIGNWGVRQRNEAGILFVPTERLGRSAVTQMSLFDNCILGVAKKNKFIKNELLDKKEIKKFNTKIINNFDVKTQSRKALASSLSGGNLQKFIVGRTILQKPEVLLIANPTWGVDISAAIFIRNQIIKLRDAGVAVLVASEDLDEMFTICDEIAVIKEGKLSPAQNINELSVEQVGLMMTK